MPSDNRVFIAWKQRSEWIMRDTELENYVLYEFSSSCADFLFFFSLTPKICQYLYIYMWNWYLIFLHLNASNIISNTKYILLQLICKSKKSALKGILPTKNIILFTLDSVSSFKLTAHWRGRLSIKKTSSISARSSQEPIIRFQKTGTVLYCKKPLSKINKAAEKTPCPVLITCWIAA